MERICSSHTEFFTSNSWRMTTSAGEYNFGSHLCWPEVAVDQNRPGSEPRVIPQLLARAVDAGDEAQIDGLFAAIDSIAQGFRGGLAQRVDAAVDVSVRVSLVVLNGAQDL